MKVPKPDGLATHPVGYSAAALLRYPGTAPASGHADFDVELLLGASIVSEPFTDGHALSGSAQIDLR